VHGVIHCAAIIGPLGPIESNSFEDWTNAVEVNLFGTFNFIQNASSTFRSQGFGNFVALSGGGSTGPSPRMSAYGASKTAVVRLVESISEDHNNPKISFNCVAPGIMPTAMINSQIEAGEKLMGKFYLSEIQEALLNQSDAFEKPIELIYHLATADDSIFSGKIVSAIWDDWKSIISRDASELPADFFTLRRVKSFDN
jgi:NAD(P)-dependent dehydrogenase (short-subunit alcohol dehydrogenase family)